MSEPLPHVQIICDEQSHPRSRVAQIQGFFRAESGEWMDLGLLQHNGNEQQVSMIGSYRGIDVDRDDTPHAAPPLTYRELTDVGGDRRRRYNLRCPLCDLNVTIRGERLPPVLSELAASGVSVVTLRAIARIVC